MREKSDRPDKITCKRCGEVIVMGRRGRIPQYCERCRRKLWRDEKKQKNGGKTKRQGTKPKQKDKTEEGEKPKQKKRARPGGNEAERNTKPEKTAGKKKQSPMEEIMEALNRENERRHRQGEPPVSYGNFAMIWDAGRNAG